MLGEDEKMGDGMEFILMSSHCQSPQRADEAAILNNQPLQISSHDNILSSLEHLI